MEQTSSPAADREQVLPTATMHLAFRLRRAVDAGVEIEREPKDEFYGERSACVRDPFGHRWSMGNRIEEVSPAEMQRRYDELSRSG